MRVRGVLPLALACLLALAAPVTARAQLFLSTRPNPEFEIGPLFVRAEVGPALGPVTLDVLWSLTIPPTRSALGLEQDLYLLWPSRVVSPSGGGDADRTLARDFEARGFTITDAGRLPLAAQNLYPGKGQTPVEPIAGGAPFVTFARQGLGSLGLAPAATYIRIPWTPRLVNRTWLLRLRLTLPGLITVKKASWAEELFWGRRHRLSIGFNDVRDPAVFPIYLEQRDRVVSLASEPSQILVALADADRLRIDEVFPPESSRRRSESDPTVEVVSLFLDTSEGRAPQELTVQFGYFSGYQAWAPILIPLLFFVLGRVAGPLVERVARRVGGTVASRLRFGRQGPDGPGREQGVVLRPEILRRLTPGQTTYEDVLRLCGRDVEEQEQLASPEQRRLIYRGRRVIPQGRRLFAGVVAVSHWDVEQHEVEIDFEQGAVRNVQVRVRRSRLTSPETA